MRLFIDIGHCDRSAKPGALQGRTIAIVTDTVAGSDHGALLACAESIAERPDAEQASRTAATALGDAYYLAVETETPQRALKEAFDAANLAVRTGGERGRASALAVLILHGRESVVGHVGNVRVWRYRDQQLKQLTRDHLAPRALGRVEVTRACGLAETVAAECMEEPLKEGDIFVLTSPGVHEALQGSAILGILQSDHTAQQMADALAQHAMNARAPGYVGTCVARVEKLPPPTAISIDRASLPLAALPAPNAKLDGFVIEKLLLKSRRFRLYRAKDRESGETVALRFPDPRLADSARVFLREERIARRIESPFILRPVALRPGRRTALYSAIEYRRAENLAKRVHRKRSLPAREALHLGEQLLAALETLHGHGVIHRDVRPHNMFYDKFTRQLWILGLGVERGDTAAGNGGVPSTALSYAAPELLRGAVACERSDIYAAGVTIYHMLTGDYPYGKIRARADWKEARAYRPLRHHDKTLSEALDEILERACAVDPQQRYATTAEFSAELNAEHARSKPADAPAHGPPDAGETPARWPWWAAAALAAGLLTYLYFALR